MPGNQPTSGSASSGSTNSNSSSNAVNTVGTSPTSVSSRIGYASSVRRSKSPFWGIATIVANNIFSFLPAEEKDQDKIKSRRAFFRALATSNNESFESTRQGIVNGMQTPFLQLVADAEMKSAEAFLKLAMVNQPMFRKLLTTNQTITQKNGMPVTGTALEIALKCWDWSCSGQEEMTEMLMRYIRTLPDGDELIDTTMQQLFPEGIALYQKEQVMRAEEFTKSILEPLSEILKNASDDDVELVYTIIDKEKSEVDEYISSNLSQNKLWQALMAHHEAIKTFMKNDRIYNPLYLQRAFEIVRSKYLTEAWYMLSKGRDRASLLSIHAVGAVQASSPTLVVMLFARMSLLRMNEVERAQFKVDRNCKFSMEYDDQEAFICTAAGVLLLAKTFWAAGVAGNVVSGSSGYTDDCLGALPCHAKSLAVARLFRAADLAPEIRTPR